MADNATTAARALALRTILQRRTLRVWAAKSAQERDTLADDIQQLFSSPSAIGSSNSNTTSASVPRAVTRRPGVEEVKTCVLASASASLPPQSNALRGEIWQVLLNVYKRTQHGASAQDFDRMMLRLGKLPRDPLLVSESADVSVLLAADSDDQQRVQRELELLLVWFLTTKSVAYTRGMARAVAPFFLLDLPLATIYDCFYQYCASFLPHLITFDEGVSDATASGADGRADSTDQTSSSDSSDSTADTSERDDLDARERQVLVEQLVSYHDPQLAHVLAQWCSSTWSRPGSVVPAGFFTGDLHETLAPRVHMFVMDQLLLTGDTLFSVFVLLALLLNARDAVLASASATDVLEVLATAVAAARDDASHVQFLCLFAARLRSRTPKSYKCALRIPASLSMSSSSSSHTVASISASRLAADIAFGVPSAAAPPLSSSSSSSSDKREAVDMTEWVKKESRSIAGKIFWYHTQTGTTQWEHPAEKHEPAPALFALPISVDEVARQVMGERTGSSAGGSNSSNSSADATASGLHFFVVDCRGLRSSEDLKSGRIPAAYTLDPSVFDSPDLIAKSMAALDPLQSKVHVVLVGHGVGVPPVLVTTDELRTSVRDAVRLDTDALNRAALFFQKRGFRFVSVLDGGYASWHAYVRDCPASSPDELLNHVGDECHYCRYDTLVRTGDDPVKIRNKQQQMAATASRFRRKKSAMPTTTDLPVNGGEGDASIVSTSSLYNNGNANRPSVSLSMNAGAALSQIGSGSRLSLTLSRPSIATMRTKLADVKLPKLQWGRRVSSTSSAAVDSSARSSGPHRAAATDSGSSSSETATLDDNGSDRGSSATDDLVDDKTDAALAVISGAGTTGSTGVDSVDNDDDNDDDDATAALQAKLEAQVSPRARKQSFVGVFTIDYSDDEDGDDDADESDAAPVTTAETRAAPTVSA